MGLIKEKEEIELLRESNQLVSKTLGMLSEEIKPGVSTNKLDKLGEEFIRDHDAEPAFLGYGGFPNSLCISINDMVVHGIPSDYVLKSGDIVTVDCGVFLNGYVGDSAYTYPVGEVEEETLDLMKATKKSLFEGIKSAVVGKRVGDIGYAVQSHVENLGYSVVREMVGHGIGENLHEKPEIPNYGKKGTGPKLKERMTICIEPMINLGVRNITVDYDGWTVRTADRKPSAHYELAVAVQKNEADFLSTFDFIKCIV